jgi:hypothetical protein
MKGKSNQRESRKKPERSLQEKRAAKRLSTEAKTTPTIPPTSR